MCRTTKFKLYEQKELKKDGMFGCNFCYNIKNLSDKHKSGNKCLDCFEKMKPKKEPKVLPTEKVCKTCEKLLPISEFGVAHENKNTGWITYRKHCYKCMYNHSEWGKSYAKQYRNSISIEKKEKYNPLKSLKFRSREQKKFKKEGKFGCNICGKVKSVKRQTSDGRYICKSCYNSRSRDYYQSNKENNWRNTYKWLKKKKSEDPFYKLIYNMRQRVWTEFKKINIEKDESTLELLGTTVGEFKTYIESNFKEGMTWDNYGLNGWHLDHIIPISSAKTEKDLVDLCHYTNLQPLWAEENMKKGNRIL